MAKKFEIGEIYRHNGSDPEDSELEILILFADKLKPDFRERIDVQKLIVYVIKSTNNWKYYKKNYHLKKVAERPGDWRKIS